MKSGAQQQQRTPATDFVQEYATKRQIQMDLAKKIREDRIYQQSMRGAAGGGGVSLGVKNKENWGAPAMGSKPSPTASGVEKVEADKLASTSVVLQVMEDDFKEATKAGIITPDQARQLWAMLSNQLIRVAPSSRESLNTGCFSTTVASLLALSSSQTSPSDADSSLNRRGSCHSTKKYPQGSEKQVEGKFPFGGSISMESLRQSIAYFKEQQEQLRQEPQAAHLKQRARAEETNSRHPPANHYYGNEEDVLDGPFNKPPSPSIPEEEEEEEEAEAEEGMDFRGPYGKGVGAVKSKLTSNNPNTKNKPDWNSDVSIERFDEAGGGLKEASPKTSAPTAVLSKSLAARVAIQKAGAPVKSQAPGGGKPPTQPPYHAPSYPSYPTSPSERSNEEREGGGLEEGARWGGNGPTPASPATLDEMAIHPNGARNGVPFKGAPGSKRKDAGGRIAALLNSNSNGHPLATAGEGRGGGNDLIAAEASVAAREPTRECGICGRTFRVSVLPRHEPLCRKQTNKPRKVFNMRAQRLEGVEGMDQVRLGVPANNSHATQRHHHAAALSNAGKIPKWRIQHEQFQAAMRAVHQQKGDEPLGGGNGNYNGKGGGGKGGYGGRIPPSLPPEFDDRVPCPHCGRKFAEEVAKRHIPKCANTVAKPKGIRPIRR
ncbi:unnamed protein product [Phytomonas sp. Hart1]|nr:unnamed protein product [Phytomonas sp. Hart1]|eukprot:CCW69092.1 unnamed protein product [Phytomonas sp. isolate Hart1]